MSNKERAKKGGEATKEKWEQTKELAINGKIDEIDADVFIKYYTTLKRIKVDYGKLPTDLDGTCGIWYYGKTGTGKSRGARIDYPDAYMKLPNKWWDGYQQQDYVIIDDFDKNHAVLGYHLKIWADRYSFSAEVKGSTIMIRPRNIIVTSNYHPKDIWGETPNTLGPILRRFRVTEFKELLDFERLGEDTRTMDLNGNLISCADNFNIF